MTAIRRVHIIAAQARKRILEELGRPVDEKTEKLSRLNLDDPRFSEPTYERRWQDDAAEQFKKRIDRVLELHYGQHLCFGLIIDHRNCRTYRILSGIEKP